MHDCVIVPWQMSPYPNHLLLHAIAARTMLTLLLLLLLLRVQAVHVYGKKEMCMRSVGDVDVAVMTMFQLQQ